MYELLSPQEKSRLAKNALDNPLVKEIIKRQLLEARKVFEDSEIPTDSNFDLQAWTYKMLAARMAFEVAGSINQALEIAHKGYEDTQKLDAMLNDATQDI